MKYGNSSLEERYDTIARITCLQKTKNKVGAEGRETLIPQLVTVDTSLQFVSLIVQSICLYIIIAGGSERAPAPSLGNLQLAK